MYFHIPNEKSNQMTNDKICENNIFKEVKNSQASNTCDIQIYYSYLIKAFRF